MYCRKCGAYMPEQAEFCPACGARNPQRAEIPVVTAPHRRNTLIIGLIVAVTVFLVAAMCCVTWLVSEGRSAEAEAAQTEEAAAPAETAGSAEAAASDTSDAAGSQTASSSGAAETEEDAETEGASTSITNNYYYYGDSAASDDGYYTGSSQSGYLWPTDTQYISMSDLSGLSQDTVAAIRNEIYARHGYAFQTERWQNYFAGKSWYHQDSSCTEDTINARLTSVERANINTIVAYEESMGWR